MSRIPLIAGNWKMYKTVPEAVETAEKLAALCQSIHSVEVMIAPNFLAIHPVAAVCKNSPVKIGAQNLYFEKQGAFTGEVSAGMIKAAGAEYVIIGHSERRQLFGESDSFVAKKIKSAIGCGLKPILCVGETEAQRDEEKTFQVPDKQVSDGLKGCGSDELKDLVLAYEPVWAIGTGKSATTDQVNTVHQYLRSLTAKLYSTTFADQVRILYGGSVKPENVSALMDLKDVDGALVGGASLEADTFINIIRFDT